MNRKVPHMGVIITSIILIIFIIFLIYATKNPSDISNTDIIEVEYTPSNELFEKYTPSNEIIEFTDSEILNSLVNQIESNQGDIIRVKKLPYQIEFNVESNQYIATHVSEYNKEMENEFKRPIIQVELIPNSRNQSIIESETISLLKLLAPTISNKQAQMLIDGEEEKINIADSSDATISVDIGETEQGNKKHITVTREYNEFIDDSENPLTESRQPVGMRFSVNYKNGEYSNYTPNLWLNQFISDMESIFNWNLDIDNVYNVYDSLYIGSIHLLPDELNDGYTKEIEINVSSDEDSFKSGLAIPSVSVRIDREWQSDDEKKDILTNIIRALDKDISNADIEAMYNHIVATEELSDNTFYGFEDVNIKNFKVSQGTSGIRLKKIFMEEIVDLPLYNLAGFSDWIKEEDTLFDELITRDEIKDLNKYYDEKSYSYTSHSNSTYASNSNSSPTSSDSTLNDTIRAGMVAVVRDTVAQREGLSGIKWPMGFGDYNIKEIAPDMFTTQGQFNHGGYIYNFELIIMMRPDTSGRIEFYNVY